MHECNRSCECKCKFDGRNCSSDQWWNNDKCQCGCKNVVYVKKIVSNHATCNCESGKHLANIMDDSAIMCDEIIESCLKLSPIDNKEETNFNKKKQPVKCKISLFYLHFY